MSPVNCENTTAPNREAAKEALHDSGATTAGSSPAKATRCSTSMTEPGKADNDGPDEYVISTDEKSELQALRRRHADLGHGRNGPAGRAFARTACAIVIAPSSLPSLVNVKARRRPT